MIPESDGAPSKGGLKSGPAWLQAIFSWPTFAVLVMLVFWTPLHQIGALVPRLVLESNLVTESLFAGDVGDDIRKWQRLKRLGLVEELSSAQLRKAEKENGEKAGHYKFGVRPTVKYDKVHKFLARAVFEIVNASLASPQAAKSKE